MTELDEIDTLIANIRRNLDDLGRIARQASVLAKQTPELRQRIAMLESLNAGRDAPADTIDAAPWMADLTSTQRALMSILLGAYPRAVSLDFLVDNVPSSHDHAKERTAGSLKIQVSIIRHILGYDAIVTAYGVGYRLGERLAQEKPPAV